MTQVLFCFDSLDPKVPEPPWADEEAAARKAGMAVGLIDFDALETDGDVGKAIRGIGSLKGSAPCIYRGWMLRPEKYGVLFDALSGEGVRLVNDPQAYRHAHYLPESLSVIEEVTPRTVWMKSRRDWDLDEVMRLLTPLGDGPVIVKDFVKSRKHEWEEACYIPRASDRDEVKRIVGRFVELQGDGFCEGFVFREFVEFESIGAHSKSGMPLSREFRLFFLDGELVQAAPYWEEGDTQGLEPPADEFAGIAGNVKSRFFTMDVARRRDGGWMIVELGDGQVAEFPETGDVEAFYRRLANLPTPS